MYSRRTLLAGVGGGLVTGLAGCSNLPLIGSSGQGYVDWIPETDRNHLNAWGAAPSTWATIDDVDTDDEWRLGVGPEDVDFHVELSGIGSSVVEGDFTTAELTEYHDNEVGELEPEGEYEGYERYEARSGTLGLVDGRVVTAPEEHFETVIDVANGDEPRLVDNHDDASELMGAVGEGDYWYAWLNLDPDSETDRLGEAASWDLATGESEFELAYLFRDEDAADEFDVDAELPDDEALLEYDSDRQGRFVVVDARYDTEEF